MLRSKKDFDMATKTYANLSVILKEKENEENRNLLLKNIILIAKCYDRRRLIDQLGEMS